MTNDDDELRDEFARLRKLDARRTPTIESMSLAPKPRPLRPLVLAVAPLVAAAAGLLFVCNGPTQSEPSQASSQASTPPADLVPAASGGAVARADEEPLPLDFLLQTHAHYNDSDFLLRVPAVRDNLRGTP